MLFRTRIGEATLAPVGLPLPRLDASPWPRSGPAGRGAPRPAPYCWS